MPTIDIVVRFNLDEASYKRVQDAIGNIGKVTAAKTGGAGTTAGMSVVSKELGNVGKVAGEAARGMGAFTAASKLSSSVSRDLAKDVGVVIKSIESLTEAEKMAAIEGSRLSDEALRMARIEEQLARSKMASLGIGGFVLGLYGRSISELGRSMLSPLEMLGSLRAPTVATLEWARAMRDVNTSVERIGESMARVILPSLQNAATFAEKMAEFMERNPMFAKAAVGGAIGLIAGGQLISMIGNLLSVVSALTTMGVIPASRVMALGRTIGAGVGAIGAGAAAFGGQAALLASAATIGAVIGREVGNYLNRILGRPEQSWRDIWQTAGRMMFLDVRWYRGIWEGIAGDWGAQANEKLLRLIDSIFDLGVYAENAARGVDSAKQSMENFGNIPKEAVDAYIDYIRRIRDLEEDYIRQREEIIRQFNNRMAKLDLDAESRIRELLEKYSESEVEYLKDLDAKRKKLLENANEELLRMTEQHNLRLRQMQRDHQNRMEDLARQRDALGMVKEQRRYAEEVKQENERFALLVAQHNRELALRLRQLEEESELEAEQRRKSFIERIKDIQQQQAEERKMLQDELYQRLSELDRQYNIERDRLRMHFADTLRAIDDALVGERNLRAQYYKIMEDDLRKFLETYRGMLGSLLPGYPAQNIPGYQSGGYVGSGGLAFLHGGEYVLNRGVTAAAEMAIGGRLTDSALLGALGGSRVTVLQNIKFSGRVSAQDKIEIMRVARQAAIEGVLSAIQ